MVDVAKLNALLAKSGVVEPPKRKPPPPPPQSYLTSVDEWPACFDIDRPIPPPVDVQPIIGPPASRLLIRGPGWTAADWVRAADLPQYADVATEYHRLDGHWLPLEAAWMDEENWTIEGYWRPAK